MLLYPVPVKCTQSTRGTTVFLCVVITDDKALTMVMEMKKPTSKITRMLLQFQEYNYFFSFRPENLHYAAGALTRLPTSEETLAEEIKIFGASEQLYDPCNDLFFKPTLYLLNSQSRLNSSRWNSVRIWN